MGSRPSKSRRFTSTVVPSALNNQPSTDYTFHTTEMKPLTNPLAKIRAKLWWVVALYNYPSSSDAEPIINVGERLTVLHEEGDWWKVASMATGKECHIPYNYVAKVYHRWLFEGITREKAEELLLLPSNRCGSFMIRESQTRKVCTTLYVVSALAAYATIRVFSRYLCQKISKSFYSLSVRRSNVASWDSIKHYRINRLPNGWFYISPRLTVPSLHDMVDYYSDSGEGLCCTLKEPCHIQGLLASQQQHPDPIVVRKPQLNWNEMDSSVLIDNDKESGEESPVSVGLREAINSYLYMTEEMRLDEMTDRKTRLKTLQTRLQSSQRQAGQNRNGNLAVLDFRSAR